MKNGQRKTHEEFLNDVYKLVGNEYKVLSNYTNQYNKVKLLHTKCNNIYEVSPKCFLKGTRCPYCSKNKKKTNEDFQNDLNNLYNNEYKLISNYTKCNEKVIIQHKCGNILERLPINILKGKMICNKCKSNKSKNDFINLITNEGYLLINNYKNSKEKVKLLHIKCNNIYEVTPNMFQQGYRCPYCAGNHKKNTKEFKELLFNLVGNEYSLIGTYKNSLTKVKIKHNKCNNTYEVTPNNFLNRDNRCPYCKQRSKGETKIRNYLNSNKYSFEEQYSFKDCKYKGLLYYDFKVNLNNTFILIEYDGIQHFKETKKFGNDRLEIQKIRDRIKDDYCLNNNIKLIRIPYYNYNNIEEILNEELKF